MSIKREYNFDQVGQKDMYLLHHEEIESLAKNIPEAKRIRFFMTFARATSTTCAVWRTWALLSTTPVNFNGQEIVPIQFLKALLPDPASPRPPHQGQDQHRLYLHRQEGRQGKDLLHLQRLRPSGVLQRGRLSGHQLHHRRACHVRCTDAADRQVDHQGRAHCRGV